MVLILTHNFSGYKCLLWLDENLNYWNSGTIQSNLSMLSPLLSSHLFKRSPFSFHVLENFLWIKPLLRSHLSEKTIFALSQSWPHNTDLTVNEVTVLVYHLHIHWNLFKAYIFYVFSMYREVKFTDFREWDQIWWIPYYSGFAGITLALKNLSPN